MYFFFFKQKTAYEMRMSDWSSDVCSSDLPLNKLGGCIELRFVEDADDLLVREMREDASRRLARQCVQNIDGVGDVLPRHLCSENGGLGIILRHAGLWHVNLQLVRAARKKLV